ncbi:glycosyltransferase family 2 protein [Echinicola rosea]|uniref:Glycosyl transferase n=1 Tax=Echinicola rosea TaxID=1807691 RepID=A0ABQ1V5Q8_9BACT|nr:glycosyltransferase family 2 protein [Echinicola rosea]GGF38015.1 glycosyl transferase [Echinicola rosea]
MESANKLVSIIIPTYNYGRFLPQTISNLKTQSYPHWEAIIVDDGSTDKTEEIINEACLEDKRFKYIKQENQGVSVARNTGIKAATGQFIQFLDADDLLSKDKLYLQVQHMLLNPNIDISYVSNQYFADNYPDKLFPDKELTGTEWVLKIDANGFEAIKSLVDRNIAVISSPLMRASALSLSSGFPTGVKHLEDWEFWLELALKNAHYQFFPNPKATTLIRVHSKSASYEINEMQLRDISFRKKITQYLKNATLSKLEYNDILKVNTKKRNNLIKELMYKIPLGNKDLLNKIKQITPRSTFYRFYIKYLNYQRKLFIKNIQKKLSLKASK